MEIIKVKYGRTINLGNYESTRIDAEADVEKGDEATNVLDSLRNFVLNEAKKEH